MPVPLNEVSSVPGVAHGSVAVGVGVFVAVAVFVGVLVAVFVGVFVAVGVGGGHLPKL